jgi:4-alpha-glucanotransferase
MEETANRRMNFFDKYNSQALQTEFTKFCDQHAYWRGEYSMFCALSIQIGTNNFSTGPNILKVCSRKTAEIVKSQLEAETLRQKVLQFFAYKQLQLIKHWQTKPAFFYVGIATYCAKI